MNDVFGEPLLRIYKEKSRNVLVAAKNKLQALQILLEQTDFYPNVDDIKLNVIRNIGYASKISKIL